MDNEQATTGKPRPKLFRALGHNDPPKVIVVLGEQYERTTILKHDSWAGTAIYEGIAGKLICKFNRQQSIFGFPMKWLGRRLARRETRVMQLMADCPRIPDDCGIIYADGEPLDYAAGHVFIPGRPMAKDDTLNDTFFPLLQDILKQLHRRDIAYVDLNKAENIIVGDDGNPYLVDFQISFTLPRWWPGNSLPMRVLLHILQRSDEYHLMKHFVRIRPDLLPPEQRDIKQLRPWWIRGWRMLATPFRETRRRLLVLLGIRKGTGKNTTEFDPEDAVRRSMKK